MITAYDEAYEAVMHQQFGLSYYVMKVIPFKFVEMVTFTNEPLHRPIGRKNNGDILYLDQHLFELLDDGTDPHTTVLIPWSVGFIQQLSEGLEQRGFREVPDSTKKREMLHYDKMYWNKLRHWTTRAVNK